ncbi:hypothetical protein Taro_042805 [Colocasia esculenta]|uniref:Thioredoxin domain-containing protein n=1 Tax=Colocasia esculenta TaxID=4460 RepID=A0A843WXF7_COLES|nr:hypothetical protein [Colocasia esculenta]
MATTSSSRCSLAGNPSAHDLGNSLLNARDKLVVVGFFSPSCGCYRALHPKNRVYSFSCVNATIKKFREALVKHSTEKCSHGPGKGLEEAELRALSANNKETVTTLDIYAH